MRAIEDEEWSKMLRKRTADCLEKNPEYKPLVEKLLSIGGDFVVIWMGEPDLDKLLSRGRLFENKVILHEMQPNNCHANIARLWDRNKRIKIVTGWALSDDGLWRQHSWGLKIPRLIETTEKRIKYFGVILNEMESITFHYNNW